jgi:hypothetical protein
MPDDLAAPPPGVPRICCEGDASADPVQRLEPARDPAALPGWLCIDRFDVHRVLDGLE